MIIEVDIFEVIKPTHTKTIYSHFNLIQNESMEDLTLQFQFQEKESIMITIVACTFGCINVLSP